MCGIVFVGDEVTAAGFRLAGVSVLVPTEGEERQVLASAAESARLVLLSAGLARRVPPTFLARLQAGPWPLLAIVPDVAGNTWPDNIAANICRHLGIAAESG